MQLIKGSYTKEDALKIIEQIIQVKINFHENKISSSENEEDIKMRENRIKDLQNDLSNFRIGLYFQSENISMDSLLKMNEEIAPTQNYSLINGSFNYNEADEILMTMYDKKINFHKIRAWSLSERGEKGSEDHTKRARELEEEVKKIKKHLLANENSGKNILLNCSLTIGFENQEKSDVSKQESIHSYKA